MATINRKLKPFTVPNYVIEETEPRPKQDGYREAPKHLLAELEPQTLAQMCDEFRAAVFAKAGMRDPAIREPEEAEYVTRVDVNIAILREIERINFREKMRRLMPLVAQQLVAAGVDFSKALESDEGGE